MRPRIRPPRLLPLTIAAMIALLGAKSIHLVRAAMPAEAPPKAAAPAKSEASAKPEAPPPPPAPAKAEAPPTPSAPPAEKPISAEERALLLDLRHRNAELSAREAALNTRDAVLAAAEKRLTARLAELGALQQRLEALEAARKSRDEANWQGLVKLYEQMKPRDAAVIFNDLDKQVLLPVLDRMKEARAAAILAAMQPERARLVTAELAAQRTKANQPPPPASKGTP